VIGKYLGDEADSAARAEEAVRRALELNPRLSVAHKFYAQLESDTGHAPRALARLLAEAVRYGDDPELFAGLVHVARYCGLYEQSVAAHEEARRLDPNVPTSIAQTLLMKGDYDRALSIQCFPAAGSGDPSVRVIALGLAGRRDEARHALLDLRRIAPIPAFDARADYLLAWLERRASEMHDEFPGLVDLRIMQDPEALFQHGWLLCDAGDHARGLDRLRQAVAGGYTAAPTLAASAAFDALREDPAFRAIQSDAEAGRRRALDVFRGGGGEQLLSEGRASPPLASPSIPNPAS
jgi:tetratricopeptide (TPR) repeat protein